MHSLCDFEKSISSKISVNETTALVEFKLVKENIGKIEKTLMQLIVAMNKEKQSKTNEFDKKILKLHRYMLTGSYAEPAPKQNATSEKSSSRNDKRRGGNNPGRDKNMKRFNRAEVARDEGAYTYEKI